MIKRSTPEPKIAIYRKLLHVTFCLGLLLPYLPLPFSVFFKNGFSPSVYYSILAAIATTINAIQIKRPLIRIELKNILQEKRRKLIEDLLKILPADESLVSKSLEYEEKIRKLEDHFNDYIDRMERSYERIGGYIGVTHGIIGVLISNILFENYVIYGILALMIVDPAAAVFGATIGRHAIPKTDGTMEGSIAAFISFFSILIFFKLNLLSAITLSLVATLAELLSIEDNLVIPLATSAVAYVLQLPFIL
ncbi:MAG: hypothetical protein DRJ38_02935 [Thermoprotei archaeon]|nr:MAG: hypothetical protein DRJ38_02935 [Thermoprotei archaeon]